MSCFLFQGMLEKKKLNDEMVSDVWVSLSYFHAPPLFPLFSSSLLLPSFVHFSLVHGDLPQHQFIHPHLTSLIVSEDVVSVIEGVFIKVSIRSSKGHTARKGFNFTEYKLISQLLVCLGNR